MGRDFGAVGMADRWQADGAKKDCIGIARTFFTARFDVMAGAAETGGATLNVVTGKFRRADRLQCRGSNRQRCVSDIAADPVTPNDRQSRCARHVFLSFLPMSACPRHLL